MSSIQEECRKRFQLYPASHMTHLENLLKIAESGKILSYNKMRGQAYFNLANEDVQAGRSAIKVPGINKPLHDYVPLYFGFKTPMAACNQGQNESLVFLRFSLDLLAIPGVVITDGNARSRNTRFQVFHSIDDLALVDAKAVQTVKYAGDEERKRRKQAEILIPEELPLTWLQDIICFCQPTAKRCIDILRNNGIKKSVIVNSGWYFLPQERRG